MALALRQEQEEAYVAGVNINWLRARMREVGLNDSKFGVKIGVNKVQMSRMLRDAKYWEPIHITKAADLLDMQPGEFSVQAGISTAGLHEDTDREPPPEVIAMPPDGGLPFLPPGVESWVHRPSSRRDPGGWLMGAKLHAASKPDRVGRDCLGRLCEIETKAGDRWICFVSQGIGRSGTYLLEDECGRVLAHDAELKWARKILLIEQG